MRIDDPMSIFRRAPFGTGMSLLGHYEMYAQFARRLSWRGTAELFDTAARLYVEDPCRQATPARCEWRAEIKRDVRALRAHGLFPSDLDDERVATLIMLERERSNFYSILLHIYAEDERAYADMVVDDTAELAAFDLARREFGNVLFSGPHVGPFHGLVPLLGQRVRLGHRLNEIMMYRSREEWKLMAHAYEMSGMPEMLRPVLIEPEHILTTSVERLRAGVCVGMLSDSTQFGRTKGHFRCKMFGHPMYAPSGPVRIAHAAGRPLFCVAVLPLADGRMRLHIREVYVPRGEPLDDETIQGVLDRKWALFEELVRLAPMSWHAIGALKIGPPSDLEPGMP